MLKYGNLGLGGVIEITRNKDFAIPKSIPNLKTDSAAQFSKIEGFSIRPKDQTKKPLNSDPALKRFLLLKDTDRKARPIYIVDGKEVNTVSNLDPNFIKSIYVSKDAPKAKTNTPAAKNGFIIITTKDDKTNQKKN